MGLFGTGSYKVMSIWPPRLLQLCFGGQIIVKTNPHKGVSHTSSHTATQPISSLLSTPYAAECFVYRFYCSGFRMFSRVPSVCKAGNAVRVPSRAECFRMSRTCPEEAFGRQPPVLRDCAAFHPLHREACTYGRRGRSGVHRLADPSVERNHQDVPDDAGPSYPQHHRPRAQWTNSITA
jgi:hypothetical protein